MEDYSSFRAFLKQPKPPGAFQKVPDPPAAENKRTDALGWQGSWTNALKELSLPQDHFHYGVTRQPQTPSFATEWTLRRVIREKPGQVPALLVFVEAVDYNPQISSYASSLLLRDSTGQIPGYLHSSAGSEFAGVLANSTLLLIDCTVLTIGENEASLIICLGNISRVFPRNRQIDDLISKLTNESNIRLKDDKPVGETSQETITESNATDAPLMTGGADSQDCEGLEDEDSDPGDTWIVRNNSLRPRTRVSPTTATPHWGPQLSARLGGRAKNWGNIDSQGGSQESMRGKMSWGPQDSFIEAYGTQESSLRPESWGPNHQESWGADGSWGQQDSSIPPKDLEGLEDSDAEDAWRHQGSSLPPDVTDPRDDDIDQFPMETPTVRLATFYDDDEPIFSTGLLPAEGGPSPLTEEQEPVAELNAPCPIPEADPQVARGGKKPEETKKAPAPPQGAFLNVDVLEFDEDF